MQEGKNFNAMDFHVPIKKVPSHHPTGTEEQVYERAPAFQVSTVQRFDPEPFWKIDSSSRPPHDRCVSPGRRARRLANRPAVMKWRRKRPRYCSMRHSVTAPAIGSFRAVHFTCELSRGHRATVGTGFWGGVWRPLGRVEAGSEVVCLDPYDGLRMVAEMGKFWTP